MPGVQFNLLPDVKLNYIKSQRSKNLITTVAFLASGAAIVLFLVVLLTVEGVQKKQLNDSKNDIAAATSQLNKIPNINQIVTVQNQLKTLVNLHQQKHITSRIFVYLPQVTPTDVNINNVALDTTSGTIGITGSANSQNAVNTFIDTLKFTTYTVGSQDTPHQAFPSVVESTFSISSGRVNFTLTVTYDPVLFSNDVPEAPVLNVPKQTTTRSAIDDPSNALFNGSSGKTGTQ